MAIIKNHKIGSILFREIDRGERLSFKEYFKKQKREEELKKTEENKGIFSSAVLKQLIDQHIQKETEETQKTFSTFVLKELIDQHTQKETEENKKIFGTLVLKQLLEQQKEKEEKQASKNQTWINYFTLGWLN